MQIATAILILLSHAGYWVGGQTQTIELRWPVQEQMPDASVSWKLTAAGATLAEGRINLPGDAGKATIRLIAPKVRAATTLQFHYRVVDAADAGKEFCSGMQPVYLAPDQLTDLAALTADSPLLIVDAADALPAMLSAAGATFDRADDLSGLAMATQKIIVIGQDRLAADDPAAAAIEALARGGASVLILRQSSAPRVLRLDAVDRDVTGYAIAADHSLLRHLPADAWNSLLSGRQLALALPTHEAALEVIHSPVEAETVADAPLDVLLVTQTLGAGRIVYCQIPLEHAAADARQQQLFLNLIEYARTRPQPTPSRSERQERLSSQRKATNEQTLSIGD